MANKLDTTFRDAADRLWTVEFTGEAIRRIWVPGLDVGTVLNAKIYDAETQTHNSEAIAERLRWLLALLSPQLHAAGVTPEDFAAAVDPRPEEVNCLAHFAAWGAVINAMHNRCPPEYLSDDATPFTDSTKA